LVWGKCLSAPPPPHEPVSEIPQVEVSDHEPAEEEGEDPLEKFFEDLADGSGPETNVAAAVRSTKQSKKQITLPPRNKLCEYPHACAALSDIATWGTASADGSDTEVPSVTDALYIDESLDFDLDDERVIDSTPCPPVLDIDPTDYQSGEPGENEAAETEATTPEGEVALTLPPNETAEGDQEDDWEPRRRRRRKVRFELGSGAKVRADLLALLQLQPRH
jgi:hypothetical protein